LENLHRFARPDYEVFSGAETRSFNEPPRRASRSDYQVLRKMARYGMIRCDALLETL